MWEQALVKRAFPLDWCCQQCRQQLAARVRLSMRVQAHRVGMQLSWAREEQRICPSQVRRQLSKGCL